MFAMVLDPVQVRLAQRFGSMRAATAVLAAIIAVGPTITVTTDDWEY